MKKRILSIILTLCMIFLFMPATVFAEAGITPVIPQTDTDGVYQIGTAAELYGFAQLVNGGNKNASAVLTADIVVNTGVMKADGTLADDTSTFASWTPIGNFDNQYAGKFDGQGHTISGLYFKDTNASYVGFFGYACLGEIKNVGVIDSYFKGERLVGGVCGYNCVCTITGCYYAGKVSGDNSVGGVCGTNWNGKIIGCRNTGTVIGTNKVGGVCGFNAYGSTMTSCRNTGAVSGVNEDVGGVCGRNNQYGKIIGCWNTGTVSGVWIVGGVCGTNNESSTITGCYNAGTVSDGYNVGGVCGYNKESTITGCHNTGTVSKGYNLGGVCGMNEVDGKITGCYTNNNGVCGENDYGAVSGCAEYEDKEFKDGGIVCGLLNTALNNAGSDVHFYQGENSPELFFIADGVYQIDTAEELYGFVQAVNNGSTSNTAKLMNDIRLSGTLDLTDKNITLDLNGYVLTGDLRLADSSASPDSILTLIDSRPTATHTDSSLPAGGVVKGKITLTRGNGSVSHLYANGGTVTGQVSLSSYAGGIFCTSNTPTAFMAYVGNYGEIHGGIFYSSINTDCIREKTVTFMNGDSRYALEVVAGGNKVAAPVSPAVKDGYQTFDGWYNGDIKYTFGSSLSENITLTAKFSNPKTFDITCDLDGGTATNPTSYTVESDAITLNNPTKTGCTFTGWSGTDLTGANNMTVTIAKGSTGNRTYQAHYSENNHYTVVFDTNGGSNISDKTGVKWTDTVLDGVTDPAKDGWEFTGWKCGNEDVTASTTYSEIAGNDTVTSVTLVAQWKEYEKTVITGLEDGRTYCSSVQFTVTETNLDTVTVNGNAVSPDENGQYTLTPADGQQIVIATDKRGNTITVKVTVNSSHTPQDDDGDCTTPIKCVYCSEILTAAREAHNFAGAWQHDETGHWHICQNEGCTVTDTKVGHSGTATCTEQAICEECGAKHGDVDSANHDWGDVEYTWSGTECTARRICKRDTNHVETETVTATVTKTQEKTCEHDELSTYSANFTNSAFTMQIKTNVKTADKLGHDWGAWTSNGDGTHIRECSRDNNHTDTEDCHGGTAACTAKAECEDCGAEYGELDSSNHDLDNIPAKDATVTETGNEEYWHCKDCGKYFADKNGTNEIKLDDTVIAKLPPEIIEGKGQSVTTGDKKELTFKSNAAFSDFIRVELDGKTLDEKNYTVKEGSTVVTLKADYVATLSAGEHTIGIVSTNGTAATTFTVNAKTVVDNDTKSSPTGDNSHMALWCALLFVSGAGVIGTTVYGKKKRAK